MVKIVIEVSDGFFEEISNFDNMTLLLKEKKIDPMEGFARLLAFGAVNKLIKNGKKEFVLTPDDAKDPKEVAIFNNMLKSAGAMIVCKEHLEVEKEANGDSK